MKEKYNRNKAAYEKWLPWLLGAIIIGLSTFIFIMSSQTGFSSQRLSKSIIKFIGESAGIPDSIKDSSLFQLANFNTLLRKFMHFFEFFTLALFLYLFLLKTGFKKWKLPNTVLLICLMFALMDEFHQIFVRGRSALLMDVIVDFAGAALAVYIVNRVRRRRSKAKASVSASIRNLS